MCLGIPGEVIRLVPENDQLALVDVSGGTREVNLGLLDEGSVRPGDWIVIHMGFAMEVVDREQADEALAGLEMMGRGLPRDAEVSIAPDASQADPG